MPWRAPYRFWRHAFCDEADVRRAFPPEGMARIEAAIRGGEATHSGQVCVAVEHSLPLHRVVRRPALAPRTRALEVFGQLRVWDTEHNNGVLIYVLLADRDVEIVADRGIDRAVGHDAWEAICRRMEAHFREGRHVDAVEAGVREVSELLAKHFPGDGADRNELPDRPVVL
jgi:uncharacterized membrane protein